MSWFNVGEITAVYRLINGFYFNKVYLYICEYFDLKFFYILDYSTYFKMMIWNFPNRYIHSNTKDSPNLIFFRHFSINVSYLTIEFEETKFNRMISLMRPILRCCYLSILWPVSSMHLIGKMISPFLPAGIIPS